MRKDTRIKVCGMKDADNIRELTSLAPDYIGFIFYPASKRFVGNTDCQLIERIPSSVKKTGVFVDSSLDEILEKISDFELDAVQLHGSETAEFCSKIKDQGVEVIKAFGLDESFDFSVLNEYSDSVDFFLFDTKTSSHGGSGKTFDWSLLQNYRLSTPYFLSGGLDSENLQTALAIDDDRFYAVDLNSRFEIEPGLKDIHKLSLIINKIRNSNA